MSEEQAIMVCIRVDDAEEGNVTVSSVIANCSECDARIWISKASQDQMVEQEGKPICIQCFKPPEGAEFVPPTQEVVKEIIEHIKHENPTDRLGDRTTQG
jgi:hypothetical protein